MNTAVTIKAEMIEQGPGFKPVKEWFVDCDGYSFGSFGDEGQAREQFNRISLRIANGETARQIYRGY